MKKILIVDDEPTILLTLSHLLSTKDTAVISCSSMEEAEKVLSNYIFDLVIADIRLSGMYGIEGLELLSYIKKLSPRTEVVIMTAYGSDEIKEDAYSRGAYYYYEKPLDLGDLAMRVKALGINVLPADLDGPAQ